MTIAELTITHARYHLIHISGGMEGDTVGTRLHECKKYSYKNSTVDERGVVSIETDDGPVQFWFDEETFITGKKDATKLTEGAGKGTLTFTWPDKNKKYLCAAMH